MTTVQRRAHRIIIATLWGATLVGAIAAIGYPAHSDSIRAVMLVLIGGAITLTLAGLVKEHERIAAECWQAGYRAGARSKIEATSLQGEGS